MNKLKAIGMNLIGLPASRPSHYAAFVQCMIRYESSFNAFRNVIIISGMLLVGWMGSSAVVVYMEPNTPHVVALIPVIVFVGISVIMVTEYTGKMIARRVLREWGYEYTNTDRLYAVETAVERRDPNVDSDHEEKRAN